MVQLQTSIGKDLSQHISNTNTYYIIILMHRGIINNDFSPNTNDIFMLTFTVTVL